MLEHLHKKIIEMEWREVENLLRTESGRAMANQPFKDDLPLHMAIERKAPEETILALLEANPQAASALGRLGGTPLHSAAQQKLSPSVLVHIIRAYPEALNQEDDNHHLPRSYTQRSELCKETLSRPVACWIEDVEKEEYNGVLAKRKMQLQQKVLKLRTSLDSSRQRREKLSMYLDALEPKLQKQRDSIDQFEKLDNQLDDVQATYLAFISTLRERIKKLSDEVSTEPDEDETMMRSFMKRTYMQGVERQYKKFFDRNDQIRKDIRNINEVLAQRKGFSPDRTNSETFQQSH